MEILSFISLITYVLVPSLKVSVAVDSIVLSQSFRDGMTIVSQDGTFELGFFSPGSNNKHYLGIWYKNIPIHKVVWVANRKNPINGSFGIIVLNSTGSLVLSQNNTILWYTTLKKQAQKPVAKLLDSGNLVVRDEEDANPEAYLWQSFDYPSDTMLPGMKVGWDLKIGLKRHLTAWKSPEDPSPGDFSWGIELNNYPQAVMRKGNEKFFRDGAWNGLHFSGGPQLKPNPLYSYNFVFDKYEAYYIFSLKNNSVISIIVMNQTDHIRYRYVWVETDKNWMVYSSFPRDYCDNYGLCGAYGNCIISDSPICQCLKGFKPKSPEKWNSMDWSQGCVRNKPLNCTIKQKDGFVKVSGLKLPDTTHTWLDQTIGLEECRVKCLNNCSCMAYTNSDIKGKGSGCALWFGDLIDIRQFQVDGQDLYIRMDASEIEAEQGHKKLLTKIIITIIAIVISGMLLLGCYYILKVRKNNNELNQHNGEHNEDLDLPLFDLSTIATATNSFSVNKKIGDVGFRPVYRVIQRKKSENVGDQIDAESEDGIDFPLVDFSTLAMATNNFSTKNKIGEGGFGPVYKGRLEHGQEVAVKRLSKSSGQGKTEFKNEVKLIAKVQHRNLVKLLGFSIHGQDKLLVYEYMPNGSLDSFIFDVIQGKVLDWSKRFLIICGIARGLMYLHKDSRLRIIHRDLKASNVLLDDMLNPKISDFGMARIIGGDQTEGNTNRVVGTYGYMAPEYAADGLFSVKSDVFSFGILLLEIIYGKRNRGFYHADLTLNLIGHAWILWKEGRTSELIDQNIEESCIFPEVLRCIHIGLLCVQQHPEDRPTMSSVVLMLESEIDLSEPKEPGFFPRRGSAEANSSSSQLQLSSTNEMTITVLEAR